MTLNSNLDLNDGHQARYARWREATSLALLGGRPICRGGRWRRRALCVARTCQRGWTGCLTWPA
eukprot:CAMPEP_0182576558 /NCGR_PEP_ID=MMETSP1324-20130603/34317_1 /TAXON_ID=236786 /ORGANISM="Florenciella sp., Strain RCC1587" /LENGTH=63 /DNA_ID=CAMNT_0024792277 /DNA_START=121 /DNA_END=308 /DNA_ORIENTATION=+